MKIHNTLGAKNSWARLLHSFWNLLVYPLVSIDWFLFSKSGHNMGIKFPQRCPYRGRHTSCGWEPNRNRVAIWEDHMTNSFRSSKDWYLGYFAFLVWWNYIIIRQKWVNSNYIIHNQNLWLSCENGKLSTTRDNNDHHRILIIISTTKLLT